jgi:hypothetical protein
VPHPRINGYPPNLPSLLEPNQRWTGAISKRSTPVDFETGIFYAQIAASHSKRTHLEEHPSKAEAMMRPR